MIVNIGGGTLTDGGQATEAAIRSAFEGLGVEADVRRLHPDAIADAFADAAVAENLDAVIAGGGDGTVSCAAGQLVDSERPLGIVPLGTLNHLARDAGIPAAIKQAAKVIAAAHIRRIDVAEVNGRIFVNNSSVGLYPDMVRFRDEQLAHSRRGKRAAMLAGSLRALRSFRRRRLWISAPGLETPIRTPLLFVGNNRYRVNLFALGRREALDGGELSLYAMRARSRVHLVWAAIRGVFGKLDQQRDFVTAHVPEAEISSDRPTLILSVDGETLAMETPLRYRIRPRALKLIVPAMPAGR